MEEDKSEQKNLQLQNKSSQLINAIHHLVSTLNSLQLPPFMIEEVLHKTQVGSVAGTKNPEQN